MEPYLGLLVPVGMVGFFIFLVVYSIYSARKRRDALALVAQKMGFDFKETDDSFHSQYKHLKLFGRGRRQRAVNILSGARDGVTVTLADYHYTTGTGKNSTHHLQTICIVTDPELQLPNFFLRHENSIFDYLGKVFGGQDINFPEDKAFSAAFVLQGAKESETRELFDPDVRRSFLKFSGTSAQIEGQGSSVIVHRTMILEPEKLPALLKDAFDVYHALKHSQSGDLD